MEMVKKSSKYLVSATAWILLSQACLATDYYVDPSAGNDGNGGSSSAPWRTIAKVNSYTGFAPGDRILLKRGAVSREQLNVPAGGSSSSVLYFGAYGSGSNPLLKGTAVVTGWSGTAPRTSGRLP